MTVYGISFDDVALQAKFAAREELNFKLLSDPDQVAGKKYGATRPGGPPFPKRVTFVIDPAATIVAKAVGPTTYPLPARAVLAGQRPQPRTAVPVQPSRWMEPPEAG